MWFDLTKIPFCGFWCRTFGVFAVRFGFEIFSQSATALTPRPEIQTHAFVGFVFFARCPKSVFFKPDNSFGRQDKWTGTG